MSNTEKLWRAVWYALNSPELPAEVKRALSELLSRENISIAAGVLAIWVGSHFVGIGEAVDLVMAGALYVSLGAQAMDGLIGLMEFGRDVIAARTDPDLRRAASRLARAFSQLGAEAALALLTRRARIVPGYRRGTAGSGGAGAHLRGRTAGPPEPGGSAGQAKKPEVRSMGPSYQLGASDGGPGQWAQAPKRAKGADYQRQITGAPDGIEYAVPAQTVSGKVLFDGYKDGKLIDAKDWDRWPPEDKDFWRQGVLDDALKQVEAANGTPIEWHFSTQSKADVVSDLLRKSDIEGIVVKVTPKLP